MRRTFVHESFFAGFLIGFSMGLRNYFEQGMTGLPFSLAAIFLGIAIMTMEGVTKFFSKREAKRIRFQILLFLLFIPACFLQNFGPIRDQAAFVSLLLLSMAVMSNKFILEWWK